MQTYDENPEQAEADIKQASDELSKLELERAVAEVREEALVAEIDSAYDAKDDAALANATRRHAEVERKLEALRQDIKSAEEHVSSTQASWGF